MNRVRLTKDLLEQGYTYDELARRARGASDAAPCAGPGQPAGLLDRLNRDYARGRRVA